MAAILQNFRYGPMTKNMILGEGSNMRAFTAHDLLGLPRLVPYDAFAVWLDVTQR